MLLPPGVSSKRQTTVDSKTLVTENYADTLWGFAYFFPKAKHHGGLGWVRSQ